ncbi:MAG: hypothetical protein Q4D90_09420 [bacterium]|nr:hypothetical protein [bacterium]
MRNIRAIAVVLGICAVMSACSGGNSASSTTSSTENSTEVVQSQESSGLHYEIELQESSTQTEQIQESSTQQTEQAEDEDNTSATDAISAQISLIAENQTLWVGDTEYGDVYFVTVSDMNQNGRLEVISSSCQGTGLYTYSQYFEVNEELSGLEPLTLDIEEGYSEADIIVDSVPVYQSDDTYFYVYSDSIRNGAAEYYENLRALYLEDGQIKQINLATKSEVYSEGSDEPVRSFACYDENDETRESTEEEYEMAADERFASMQKKTASFSWLEQEELLSKGVNEQEAELLASYQSFQLK